MKTFGSLVANFFGPLGGTIVVFGLTVFSHKLCHAQGLDDSIQSEIDRMAGGAEPTTSPTEAARPANQSSVPRKASLAPKSVKRSKPPKAVKVSDDQWALLVRESGVESFVVSAGETLWGVSEIIFGDGRYWEQIWRLNKKSVKDPARLTTGQVIRLVAGTRESAPMFSVVPASDMTKINEIKFFMGAPPVFLQDARLKYGDLKSSDDPSFELSELTPRPELPPLKKRADVMTDLPPSFRPPVLQEQADLYKVAGIDIEKPKSSMAAEDIYVANFILDGPPRSVGKVEEIENGIAVASIGQPVIVSLEAGGRVGQRLSVLQPIGRIQMDGQREVGPLIEVGGEIEVIGVVDAAKRLYRALVIRSINPIRSDALVSMETLPRFAHTRRGTLLDIETEVIGGETGSYRRLFGEGAIVYLNAGQKAGLSTGDFLPVQANRIKRRASSKVPEFKKPIGLLKLVKVEDAVATAVVVEASEEIMPGDRTGGQILEQGTGEGRTINY